MLAAVRVPGGREVSHAPTFDQQRHDRHVLLALGTEGVAGIYWIGRSGRFAGKVGRGGPGRTVGLVADQNAVESALWLTTIWTVRWEPIRLAGWLAGGLAGCGVAECSERRSNMHAGLWMKRPRPFRTRCQTKRLATNGMKRRSV